MTKKNKGKNGRRQRNSPSLSRARSCQGNSKAEHLDDLSKHKGSSGVKPPIVCNLSPSDGRSGSGEDQPSPRFDQLADFDQDDPPMNKAEQTTRQSPGAGNSVNTERLVITECSVGERPGYIVSVESSSLLLHSYLI